MRAVARSSLGILLGLLVLWWGGALAARLELPAPWPQVVAAGWVLAAGGALLRLRPVHRAVVLLLASNLALGLWWSTIRPSNHRDWAPEYARVAWGEVEGDRMVVYDVRNFAYRTERDFTPRWETRRWDLGQLTGLDLFLSYWGSPAIAHTILSWQFAEGPPLAVSIETRRERDEEYSAWLGFFRQFEIAYVAADERDVIRLRSNVRGEDVYLYRLAVEPVTARALLLDYLRTMRRLRDEPAWYNALTQNCTTAIWTHAIAIGGTRWPDWRMVATGYVDRMLYDRGRLDTTVAFAALRGAARVNARARAADSDPDFSRAIRVGVPPGGSLPAVGPARSESEADEIRPRLSVGPGEVELGLALGVDLEEGLPAGDHVPDGAS